MAMIDFTREELETFAEISRKALGANLAGIDLSEANLHGAFLFRANLRGANLSGANLQGAYLCEANLNWADLRGANLRHAVLVRADLYDARYDKDTIFPKGFDPEAAGMVLVVDDD